jgi:hypothetical protein
LRVAKVVVFEGVEGLLDAFSVGTSEEDVVLPGGHESRMGR